IEPRLLVALLQAVHDAHGLVVVLEAAGLGMTLAEKPVEDPLAGVAEGRVPEVVPERDGFGQVLVQAQRAGRAAGDLRDLDRVGQPRPEVVPFIGDEDLGLVLQAPERARVDDPVAVARVFGPRVAFHGPGRAARARRADALGGEDREPLLLQPLETLPGELRGRDRHRVPSGVPAARRKARASPTRYREPATIIGASARRASRSPRASGTLPRAALASTPAGTARARVSAEAARGESTVT